MIALLGRWAEQFGREGVRLSVYNAQSLLAETLPVYGT
jgi:hypothetical protein